MASRGDEYDPDVYIEDYKTVHKIIISSILEVDELLKRGSTQYVGDWLNSNHLEEIQSFKIYLHKIVNELEEGYRINLEIKDFKQKFGTNLENFNTYNIPLSPMTEYPAANLTLRSQLYSNVIEFTREIDLINIILTSENDNIIMNYFVTYDFFVNAKNIILQAGKNKWTIVLIAGVACILALAGYCIDNAYTAGMACKARMQHLLEYRKQIYDKQILEDLISRNRLNKIRLQTLEKNVSIENQQIMRSDNRYNFQIMDNYSGKAYQPYPYVKEYNSLQYSSRGNYRRANSCDARIDSNNTRGTNNRGDGRGNNDSRSANNPGARMDNNNARSANNPGVRMDNNNARSANSHGSIDYCSTNSYDSMDYYSANSCDTWIDSNSAKRANSHDDSRNDSSANQFI